MPKKLVIVESPTKAKTIGQFLGKNYVVEASFGHVRDLPKSKMGIDIEKDFAPSYIVPTKARKRVTELKKKAKNSSAVLFATDEDREGEAISWHLAQLLGIESDKVQRIVFHEITKQAIEHALANPRPIDLRLVDAQQARRILDRLVGYELSPFLWKKLYKGLSAGRVQSVAVRFIIEREREILAFKPQEYWSITGKFLTAAKADLEAQLVAHEGNKIDKLTITSQEQADNIQGSLKDASWKVVAIRVKEQQRSASAPFTTSTLQQEANNRLGFSSKQTMVLAQQLYEGVTVPGEGSVGLITYMRTDSVSLSEKFRTDAAAYVSKEFGAAASTPRQFKGKQKGAQEAHESVRPTEASRTPAALKEVLEPGQWKLYDLIWKRAVASQMENAVIEQTSIDVDNEKQSQFRATGSRVKSLGWMNVYPERVSEFSLPEVKEQETVDLKEIVPKQHFTEPPPRYTEASLVKALEEKGIGRPSTYAPTISTIVDRGYVEKEEKKLKPTEIGFLVNDLLVEHFPTVVDYDFTAKLETDLDRVADGEATWQPIIQQFYQPFHAQLMIKQEEVKKHEETTNEVCEKCGKPMIIKFGRFGKFLACTGFPDCRNTKQLGEQAAADEAAAVDQKCDLCSSPMVVKRGRFGTFLGCSKYPDCKGIKKIEKLTGITCPKCSAGELAERRSKRGRNFYSCSTYPKCDFAMWNKPTGEKCPRCQSLLGYGTKGSVVCSNKECEYKTEPAE